MKIAIVFVLFCGISAAQTALDDIIAKTLAARGGLARIQAVRSQRMVGRISFASSGESKLLVEMQRPGRMFQEMWENDKPRIRLTDGKTGWEILPGAQPRQLSAGELRNMSAGTDFDGPLVDWKAKGNRIEYGGKVKADGRDAHRLKITMKDGTLRLDDIDAATFLETQWEGTIVANGKEYTARSVFREYRRVAGLMFPSAIESETLGLGVKQTIVFEKIEVDPAIDPLHFGPPKGK